MNLARLNHILIPATAAGRARARQSSLGRLVWPLFDVALSLTPEGRVAILVLLFLGGVAADVFASNLYWVWCALLGVVLGSLVARRSAKLTQTTLEVVAPRRAQVGDEVSFLVIVTNTGSTEQPATRLEGPFLPWDGAWLGTIPAVPPLAAGASAHLMCRAKFKARGLHHLEGFRLAPYAPLGLFLGAPLTGAETKLRIVPRLARVDRIEIPSRQRHQPGGVALASQLGESMELLGVRPYRVGDSVRDLHAKTWARLGQPAVREHRQEYFTRIGVIVDTDHRRATERAVEATISLAAGIVARLARGEALVDLLVMGEDIHSLTVGRSLGCVDQALDLLGAVGPGPPFDPDRLCLALLPHLSRLSCVVIVATAWDAQQEQLAVALEKTGTQCKCVALDTTSHLSPKALKRWVSTASADSIEQGRTLCL